MVFGIDLVHFSCCVAFEKAAESRVRGGVVPTGFDEEKPLFTGKFFRLTKTKTTRALRPNKFSETKCQKAYIYTLTLTDALALIIGQNLNHTLAQSV